MPRLLAAFILNMSIYFVNENEEFHQSKFIHISYETRMAQLVGTAQRSITNGLDHKQVQT